MFKKTLTAGLTAIALSFGAAAIPSTANAGGPSVDLYFGTNGAGVHIYDAHERGHGKGYRSGKRHHDRDYRHSRRDRHWGTCSPREAVWKARDHGIRHAHVDRVNRRFVVVEGRKRHYGKVKVAFYRDSPRCEVAWVKDRGRNWR